MVDDPGLVSVAQFLAPRPSRAMPASHGWGGNPIFTATRYHTVAQGYRASGDYPGIRIYTTPAAEQRAWRTAPTSPRPQSNRVSFRPRLCPTVRSAFRSDDEPYCNTYPGWRKHSPEARVFLPWATVCNAFSVAQAVSRIVASSRCQSRAMPASHGWGGNPIFTATRYHTVAQGYRASGDYPGKLEQIDNIP